MNMKKSLLVLSLASVMTLTACDKVQNMLSKPSQKTQSLCNSEQTKQQVQQLIVDKIAEQSKNSIKRIIHDGTEVDIAPLGKMVKSLNVSVQDIRTEQADAHSKKHQCAGTVSIQIPSAMVEEADLARKIKEEGQNSVQQEALLADLKFDNNAIVFEYLYKVQPTDDGKKQHVVVENGHLVSRFASNIVIDAMLKPSLEKQQREYEEQIAEENRQLEAEIKEEEQKEAEKNKVKAEYQAVLEKEAQQKLDKANANLNLVWNDAEPEIREELLSAQKVWLKKRELECKLKAQDEEDEHEKELVRLKCEENMTNQRASELKVVINQLRKELQE